MNGYECGMCDCDPCVCAAIERRKRIKEGKEAIEGMAQASQYLTGFRRWLVKHIWPDALHAMDETRKYYEANGRFK